MRIAPAKRRRALQPSCIADRRSTIRRVLQIPFHFTKLPKPHDVIKRRNIAFRRCHVGRTSGAIRKLGNDRQIDVGRRS
jgi:hypothetical protein